MASEVDLYDGHYGQLATDLQGEVRLETYEEDLGQASWIKALTSLRARDHGRPYDRRTVLDRVVHYAFPITVRHNARTTEPCQRFACT